MAWKKEEDIVNRTKIPITKDSLIQDFQKLGLRVGDVVIVHSSMSKIGWIVGGEMAVISALMEVLTSKGTLIMPAHSGGNTEPSQWHFPPVPEDWWPIIRAEMPPFRSRITPTRAVGKIPELFRTYPDVFRSPHPQNSFVAWGFHAQNITKTHALTPAFGRNTPLGKIYALNGKILLLGVDHGNNTSLHLAEIMAELKNHPQETQGAAILQDNAQKWVEFQDIEYDEDDFIQIGAEFEKKTNYQSQLVGQAPSKLLPARNLIDFAITWLKIHRKYSN
jgi:aminoglycoside 3-N-acetyltransferase